MTESFVRSDRTIFTRDGIVGGGDLAGDRTLGLEPISVSGTGPKPTVDGFGRIIALTGFSVTDFTETLGGMPVVETRKITTQDGLIGGGPLNADLILSLDMIHPARNGPVPVIDEHGRVIATREFREEDFSSLGGMPALSSTRIIVDETLIGGGDLSRDITLGLTPVSPVGSGPKPFVDGYGRVVGWTELAPGEITTGLGYTPMNPVLNLADVQDRESARSNLGLKSAAVRAVDGPEGVPVLDRNSRLPMAYFPAALLGGLCYRGVWNARLNEPELPGASSCPSHFYLVGVAGPTLIDGITDWEVGDIVISNGSAWEALRGLLKA